MVLTVEMKDGRPRRWLGEVRIMVMVSSDCGGGSTRVGSQVLV